MRYRSIYLKVLELDSVKLAVVLFVLQLLDFGTEKLKHEIFNI